jgi:hypothetical protein
MTQKTMHNMPQNMRIIGACWLSASMGIAILQVRVLALGWQQGGASALFVSLVASAWLLGAFIALRWRIQTRLWPYVLLVWACLWALIYFSNGQYLLPATYAHALACLELAAAALTLGWCGTAWLSQMRQGWAPVSERWMLIAASLCGTTALVLVWLTLDHTILVVCIGLGLLLPLMFLEAQPAGHRPMHMPGGLAEGWTQRVQRTSATSIAPFRLDQRAMPRGWWLSYLSARGRLALTLFASVLAIILGSMWAVVPTAFAGSLQAVGLLGKLPWLLAGQICASACSFIYLAWPGRGVFGTPDRVLPASWQQHARWLACIPPAVMAVSLFTLGYPTLQQPWQLGISLGTYTLGAIAWNLLLPRLRPSLSVEVTTARHLYTQPAITRILPLRTAEEALINRRLLTIESVCTILLAPFMGLLIDHFTVDGVLMRVGICLGILTSIGLVTALLRQPKHSTDATPLNRWIGSAQPAPTLSSQSFPNPYQLAPLSPETASTSSNLRLFSPGSG